jgi:hypothetical protein
VQSGNHPSVIRPADVKPKPRLIWTAATTDI